jgi:anti-sigma regulatory factor (Ser/Thr protein kinase)
MHKKFVRSYDSLKEIFEFTEAFFEAENVAAAERFPVHFAMEELFTNMVKYNPGNDSDILLDVDRDEKNVTVTITDFDVGRFDVTKERKVDTESPLPDRPVGGLGLHLIRHMVDTLDYHYSDRQSRITFTKGIG